MAEAAPALLEVRDLSVAFGAKTVVEGVSLAIAPGEKLALVGESGSGKTVTALSLLRLLHDARVGGSAWFDDGRQRRELLALPERELRGLRGDQIAMIFQEPMTSLNPLMTVGQQLEETLQRHEVLGRRERRSRVSTMLDAVKISHVEKRLQQYPHELSGGMRQRVMIAMALACEPDILIADEPTTALDVTIQAQILELMQDLPKRLGMAIIMVTHDLGVIAELCDEIIVMYGGRVCERGTADEIFYNPRHEYTRGLLRSIPNAANMKKRLIPISGTPINMLNMPKGCAFCPRCDSAMKICLEAVPDELTINENHRASCWLNVRDARMAAEKGAQEK